MPETPDPGRRPAAEEVHYRRLLRNQFVTLLEGSQSVRSAAGRQLFLQELESALGRPPLGRDHEVLHLQLVEIVSTCAQQPGALRAMTECLEILETNAPLIAQMRQLADEWQALEVFQGREIRWLRDELLRLHGNEVLRRLITASRSAEAPPHCVSAWHVFAHLAGLNPGDGMPPLLRFLDAVAPLLNPNAERRVQDLASSLADSWGLSAQLYALRTRQSEPPPGPGMAYLVIQFEKYGGDDDSYLVSHWHQWASRVWQPVRGEDQLLHRDDLEVAVDGIVTATERRWAEMDGPVTIEFVLPWELLNTPVDTWHKELSSRSPTPLAMDYPIVVRSLERLHSLQWHRLWRSRWRLLTDGSYAAEPVYFAEPDQTDIRLDAILRRETDVVAMVLHQPPTPSSLGESQALAGLRAGLPILIWHRCQLVDPSVRAVVSSLLEELPSGRLGLAQLPSRVARLRQRAWGEEAVGGGPHVGHGLAILWDDPHRQPGRIWPPDSASERGSG